MGVESHSWVGSLEVGVGAGAWAGDAEATHRWLKVGTVVEMRRVAAVVLCAGGASRWQASAAAEGLSVSHKLLAPLRGRTIVEWAIEHALEAALDATIVVSGSVALPVAITTDARVTIVHNPRWIDGQAGSLGLGLEACAAMGVDAAICGLGDQPFIESDAWELVARSATGTPIAVATYGGARRNPVRLDASVWPLVPRTGDEGARALMRSRPDWVTEVACQGNPADIDTVEDLLSWS